MKEEALKGKGKSIHWLGKSPLNDDAIETAEKQSNVQHPFLNTK